LEELDTVVVFIKGYIFDFCPSGEGGDEVDQEPFVGSICVVLLDVWSSNEY